MLLGCVAFEWAGCFWGDVGVLLVSGQGAFGVMWVCCL